MHETTLRELYKEKDIFSVSMPLTLLRFDSYFCHLPEENKAMKANF